MGGTTTSPGGGWTPPPVEHLQALLPQYQISRLLGRGGMGAVYEGVQTNLDRRVAIKILPEILGEDEESLNFTERFRLEARSMASLDHPGIISVYDFGQTSEGQLYFVMEFIDGMDIHQYLQHHGGRLPPESAIAIAAHVLDALGYAHDQGIIHRDIKPANVMIKSDGRVKVADFGLVKRLADSAEEAAATPALTMTNMAIGTPDFVAPESLESGRAVDRRADLYAVGVMLYQMLTGSLPRGNFRPPSGRVEGLDPRLDDIVSKAMEADPDDRYPDAVSFRAAIDTILSNPVPEVEPTGPVTVTGKRFNLGATGPVSLAASVQAEAADAGVSGNQSHSGKPKSSLPLMLGLGVGLPVLAGIAIFAFLKSGKNPDPVPTVAENSNAVSAIKNPPAVAPPSTEPAPSPQPATPSPPDTVPETFEPVDLIPLVDLALTPNARREGDVIHVEPRGPIVFDLAPPDRSDPPSYVIDAVISCEQSNGFVLALPVRDRRLKVEIDSSPDQSDYNTRQISVNLAEVGTENDLRRTYPVSQNHVGTDEAHRLVARVSEEGVIVEIDGKRLVDHRGGLEMLPPDWHPNVGGQDCQGRAIFDFFGPYTIHRLRLLPIDVEPDSLDLTQFSPATKPTDSAPIPEGAIDLLAQLDLEKDMIAGQWSWKDDRLVHDSYQAGSAAIRLAPVPLPEEYDLEFRLERLSHVGGGVNLGFTMSGRQGMLGLNGNSEEGGIHFEVIDGIQEWWKSPAYRHGHLLEAGEVHDGRLEVRKTKLILFLDGKQALSWEGNPSQLSLHPSWAELMPDPSRLYLGARSEFAFHRLVFVPKGDPAPPPAMSNASPEPVPTDDLLSGKLAEIDAKYRAAFETPYHDAYKTLNDQFSGALGREEQTASGSGDLDLVLAFQNEAKAIGNGQGAGPADAADAPPRLKQLRATWHQQHAKLEAQMEADRETASAARDRALNLLQQQLVKDGDIAAAQRVKAIRDGLVATAPPAPARPAQPESAGEWIELFDGKSLDDWRAVGGADAFDVSGGAIRGRGAKALLYYEGDSPEAGRFGDFEFEANVRTEEAFNSGIYFHKDLGEQNHAGTGIEAQIANENRDQRKTGSLYQLKDVGEMHVPDGRWFLYRIRSEGDTITVWIDDEKVNDWTRPATGGPSREGFFALQSNASNPDDSGEVHFKDIRVRRLASSPPSASSAGVKLPDFPPARQRIIENGGALHVWGIFDGKPIDEELEKLISRSLRERDYAQVAVGLDNFYSAGVPQDTISMLAVRRSGEGVYLKLPPRALIEARADAETREFRNVPLIDRNGRWDTHFIADRRIDGNPNSTEFEVDQHSRLAFGQDYFLVREVGGSIRMAGGLERLKPDLAAQWNAVCESMTADQARLFVVNAQSAVVWINEQNQFRMRKNNPTSNVFEEVAIEPQPGEPILHLEGDGNAHGNWIALGESGKVYADKRGGFSSPVGEWPLARQIRLVGDKAGDEVVLQKADGSWEFTGTDPELKAFLSQLGPAIDLDVYVHMENGKVKHRVVVWAEPESSL